jgi:Protein of unknown function (DUF1566)/Stigma-specific protein, Stig1
MWRGQWRTAGMVVLAALSAACNAILGMDEGQPFPPEAGIGTGGEGGAGSGTMGSGTGGSCARPNVACNGVCVDLATDPANCGECGRACNAAAMEICSGHCTTREWALWSVSAAPSLTAGVDTVFDNVTGLTWQRFTELETYTQAGAKAYCAALNVDGMGWRLPTRIELQSIIDYSRAEPGPTIDTSVFTNAPNNYFWSASLRANSDDYGVYVDFRNGDVLDYDANLDYSVRCVR